MSEPNHSAEEKLRTLGEHLRQVWAKQHPVTDKELRAVNAALEEQWAQTHPADATKGPVESPSLSSEPSPTTDQTPAQPDKRQDHDHEQSQ